MFRATTKACRRTACLVLSLAAVAGCMEPRDAVRQAEEDDGWPCEREGYPCTWAEVDTVVVERSLELGEQALDRFTGSAEDLVEWLEDQPNVVEAVVEEPTVIRIRLEGGRPVFIESHGGGADPEDTLDVAMGARVDPPVVLEAHAGRVVASTFGMLMAGLAPSPLAVGVTGRDRNSDRKINQRDQRKALVLDPMYWEECYHDLDARWIDLASQGRQVRERRRLAREVCDHERGREALLLMDQEQGVGNPRERGYEFESVAEAVAQELESIEAYAGNVTYKGGQEVDLSAFDGWQQYDVIHVSSHGSRRSITLGASVNRGTGHQARGPLANRRGLDPWVADTWGTRGAPSRWVWSADRRFFRGLYPQGLDRTLIYFSSCNTLGHPDRPAPPLVSQLLGRESIFVGWGGSVDSRYKAIPLSFYTSMGEGWSGREAIRRLPVVSGLGAYGDPLYSTEATHEASERRQARELRRGEVLGAHGTDMRIREVTRLVYLAGSLGSTPGGTLRRATVQDGDDLNDLLHGAAGDGEADHLRVAVRVDAIKPAQVDSVTVHLELDGAQIGEAKKLSEGQNAGSFERHGVLEASIHFLDFPEIPLNRDLQADREYELEAVVELPEGGETRYSARVKAGEPCEWNATVSGPGVSRSVKASWGHVSIDESRTLVQMVPHTVWLDGDPQPEAPWTEIELISVGVMPRLSDTYAVNEITGFTIRIPGIRVGDVGTYNRVWGSLGIGTKSHPGNAAYLRRDLVGLPEGSGIGHVLTTNVTLTRNDDVSIEGRFEGLFLDRDRFEELDIYEQHPLGVGIHEIAGAAIRAEGQFSVRRDGSCRMRTPRPRGR